MYECMNVWMYECMNVWMDEWMNVWMYVWIDWLNSCQIDEWIYGWMDQVNVLRIRVHLNIGRTKQGLAHKTSANSQISNSGVTTQWLNINNSRQEPDDRRLFLSAFWRLFPFLSPMPRRQFPPRDSRQYIDLSFFSVALMLLFPLSLSTLTSHDATSNAHLWPCFDTRNHVHL